MNESIEKEDRRNIAANYAALLERVRDDLGGIAEGSEAEHVFPSGDERFALVERNAYDGRCWVTVWGSPADAADYYDGQEYPEDFEIILLVDLVTGEEWTELDVATHTTFAQEPSTLLKQANDALTAFLAIDGIGDEVPTQGIREALAKVERLQRAYADGEV